MKPPAKTILLVDDIPANLGVLFDTLEAAGYRTRVAESGERALEAIATSRPDIVLLDVLMPGLDGFETCRRLKADERTADIPVLFMTALTEVVDKIRGFQAGAVDYLSKPLHPDEVLARVGAHLRLRELHLEAEQRADELDREMQRRIASERELQRALDRATIVASNTGEILFCSDRATRLLTRYFGLTAPRDLPAELFTLDPGSPLRVKTSTGPSGFALLWLDEVAPPPSPAALVSLGLTPRETEILFWLAQGKTNGEIGVILGTARTTVKKHVENMLPKLGVETRLAAALRAMECLGLSAGN